MASSNESKIAITAKACLDQLLDSLNTLEVGENEILWNKLLDQTGRLQIWISNIGVFADTRASLDYRLWELPDLRDLIVQLLESIQLCLETFANNFHTKGNVELLGQSEHQCSSEGGQLVDKSGLDEDSDINVNSFNLDDDSDSDTDSDPHELMASVEGSIDCLHLLSNSICKASSRGHNKRAKDFPLVSPDDVDKSMDLTQSWMDLYAGTIKREFPGLEERLRTRLARSIVLRRRRIMYMQSRQQRWAPQQKSYTPRVHEIEPEPQENATAETANPLTVPDIKISPARKSGPTTTTPSQATATTLHPQLLEWPKPLSTAFSASSSRVNKHESDFIPPQPSAAKKDKDFVCPYCCIIIPSIDGLDKRKWLTDWTTHMRFEHCMKWHCVANIHKPLMFSSESEYIRHVREDHPGAIRDEDLKFIAKRSAEPMKDIFDRSCPFCGDSPSDPVAHIGDHLRFLALYTLPLFDDDEVNSNQASLLNNDTDSVNRS
ncbi:hypothetical protein AJ79_00372 [Helicocarpus griseus UAMH5409]|uniref:Uncharacterized protein n=1 Tax=Helicocarpus griseus UAMH5409 TaxID=1447875 RepID=A0A2B7YC35_9EURO|nr:hypothetical protein AJ79_00372 [Helicocarpus griseus UAMH5409]